MTGRQRTAAQGALIGPEHGNGPSANGVVVMACTCRPLRGQHADSCERDVAPLGGQPPRATSKGWGIPPKRWR